MLVFAVAGKVAFVVVVVVVVERRPSLHQYASATRHILKKAFSDLCVFDGHK